MFFWKVSRGGLGATMMKLRSLHVLRRPAPGGLRSEVSTWNAQPAFEYRRGPQHFCQLGWVAWGRSRYTDVTFFFPVRANTFGYMCLNCLKLNTILTDWPICRDVEALQHPWIQKLADTSPSGPMLPSFATHPKRSEKSQDFTEGFGNQDEASVLSVLDSSQSNAANAVYTPVAWNDSALVGN